MYVQAKKHLGQHFLKNAQIAADIATAIQTEGMPVLEIGPGTGALTTHLLTAGHKIWLSEIDRESIAYLLQHFPQIPQAQYVGDFLHLALKETFPNGCVVAGNFPYNISTQILFRIYEQKELVPEMVGMFQKEVAERISAPPGSKIYGIQSVLLQAFYDIEYLFTVSENEFIPPPKVKSGAIRMTRKPDIALACDEVAFKRTIKMAFNQRRKTLRNSLRAVIPPHLLSDTIFNRRPEQLSWQEFVSLTNLLHSEQH